jgi:hypothetical protein
MGLTHDACCIGVYVFCCIGFSRYENHVCDLPAAIGSSTSFGAVLQAFDYTDDTCAASADSHWTTSYFVRNGCTNTYDSDTGVLQSFYASCATGYSVYNGHGCTQSVRVNARH